MAITCYAAVADSLADATDYETFCYVVHEAMTIFSCEDFMQFINEHCDPVWRYCKRYNTGDKWKAFTDNVRRLAVESGAVECGDTLRFVFLDGEY